MPQVPTYIRQGDWDRYIAIQSKGRGAWTEFIHNALNPRDFSSLKYIVDDEVYVASAGNDKPIKTPTVDLIKQTQDEVKDTVDKQNIKAGNKLFNIKSPKDAKKAWQGPNFKKGKK